MAKSNKFGTFGGVFTPSILTILGVIMYMRLPMIIGESGLFATIGIIIVAHIISVSTGLSVSSIATDKKVQAGGTYYMISRSLGLPIGGTLGLALFVGLSFSVSLYLIGFAESFLSYWGYETTIENIRIAGSIILLLVTIITFISTSLAIKTQYIIMAAIGLSLVSIFFGKHEFMPEQPFLKNPGATIPLMVLFGIFFPAVTGFEAGVSMSGDLKDPKKSIPMGTISAIMIGLIVYIILVFFFSFTVDHEVLAKDPQVLLKIAWIPELVIAGIWGATLSSALGSILSAPRILQATASDRITHRFFAKGTGKTNEPRNALLLTFFIAEAGIMIGELNVIARIVSIFFITTYGFLNLSCAFERLTSADFRPAFKTPAWISIVGATACMIVMIQLDFVAMLGATVILGAVYLLIKRKELALQSGDAWGSFWASIVKSGLKKLQVNTLQNRNWRPNIIMFSGEESLRPHLISLGKDISGKLGILTSFHLEESDSDILPRTQETKEKKKETDDYFINYHACRDIYTGMDEIIRVFGFNGIAPNTILMGWSLDEKNKQAFTGLIKRLETNNFNSAFLKYDAEKGMGQNKTIDIWWSGWGSNLSFAINLIRHLTSSSTWTDPKIRLFVVTNDSTLMEIIYKSLENILYKYRVDMEIKVINNSIEQLSKNQIIYRESGNTDLTIVGIPDKKFHEIEKTYNEITELSRMMGTILLINASKNFEEYNIIHDEKELADENKQVMGSVELPVLKTSKYPVINEKLEHFDTTGLQVLEMFYEKAFLPFFREQNALIQELQSLPSDAFNDIKKLELVKEKYQAFKMLNNIREHLSKKAIKQVSGFNSERIVVQKNVLASGIEWYCDQLSKDTINIPKTLTVKFDRADFIIQKSDKRSLRWYKRKKRWLRPFSRKSISNTINFRKITRLYLEQNRQQYLNDYLKEINISNLKFIHAVRDWFVFMDEQMEFFNKQIGNGGITEQLMENRQAQLQEKLSQIDDIVNKNNHYFKNELLIEFRKNIQLLAYDLEKININKLIYRRKRSNKFYRQLKEKNILFPGNWYEDVYHLSNKLFLDLVILNLKNKTRNESHELYLDTSHLIHSKLISPLEEFNNELNGLKDNKADLHQMPELNIDNSFFNPDEFLENLNKKIVEVVEELPEEIKVFKALVSGTNDFMAYEKEVMEIPVRKMAKHFIDSQLIGSLDEELENMGHKIKKLTYQVKDHISYMNFELENLDLTNNNKSEAIKEIIQSSLKELEDDLKKINNLSEGLHTLSGQSLDKAFEPISPHKITQSSKELAQIIHEYQSRKTKSRLDNWKDAVSLFFRKKAVWLLYSQSEGILLARQLTEQKSRNSLSEKVLELVEKVSPDPSVSNSIPAYYKNLFSGRSSISEDFWIERKIEEQQFSKAVHRYNMGHMGGVLITGERNSGKTAFCRHVTRIFFQNNQVYHIFPPLHGTIQISDFEYELNHVIKLNGNAYEVFEKLPYGRVMVFHDLELWWELSENGFLVIRLILDLIKKFSDKCLIIANINSLTYHRINEILELENSFVSIISIQPFDSEELKELIMRRHRSGGVKYSLGKRHEEVMSEIRLAGLFNKYFNYSKGNPGGTLYAWISHIKSYAEDHLEILPPEKPNTVLFESLHDDWQVVLYQIVLHKRMNISKLNNVLKLDNDTISRITDALLMTGLIKEKLNGLYVINPYVDKFLTDYLLQKNKSKDI